VSIHKRDYNCGLIALKESTEATGTGRALANFEKHQPHWDMPSKGQRGANFIRKGRGPGSSTGHRGEGKKPVVNLTRPEGGVSQVASVARGSGRRMLLREREGVIRG